MSVPILERLEERCLLAVFTVTTAADNGPGSLRQAILDANANAGLDAIAFDIGDGGVQTIRPSSALPLITDPVLLDGTTQLGCAGQPLIVLNGANTPSGTDGLTITGGGSTVRGLVIQGFRIGIVLDVGGNNSITGNYLGTDSTGTEKVGISNGGMVVFSSNNTVGGTEAGAGNLISGNAGGISIGGTGNLVQGNYIGTDASGTKALANAQGLFVSGSDNRIGGTEPGARNLISGNTDGITITGRNNVVQGNYVGTDTTGTLPVANRTGVIIRNDGNLIGGTEAGAGNLISGNTLNGVLITSAMGGPGPQISPSSRNVIQGNTIGTDVTGTRALANGTGIALRDCPIWVHLYILATVQVAENLWKKRGDNALSN